MWKSYGFSFWCKKKVDSKSTKVGNNDVAIWDWEAIQKFVYGTYLLKPTEFWHLQPKDIILVVEGFMEQRKYQEAQQLETWRLIRYVGHTVLMTTPMKKGAKKPSLKKYYPLPKDTVKVEMTFDENQEMFSKRQSFITNGKLRGWYDRNGCLYDERVEGKQIGNIIKNEHILFKLLDGKFRFNMGKFRFKNS